MLCTTAPAARKAHTPRYRTRAIAHEPPPPHSAASNLLSLSSAMLSTFHGLPEDRPQRARWPLSDRGRTTRRQTRPRQRPNAPNRGIWRARSGIRPPLAAALDTRAPRAAHGRDTAGGACIHDPMRTSGAAGSRHGVRRPANTPILPHQRPPRAYFRLGGYRGPDAGWWPATPRRKTPVGASTRPSATRFSP